MHSHLFACRSLKFVFAGWTYYYIDLLITKYSETFLLVWWHSDPVEHCWNDPSLLSTRSSERDKSLKTGQKLIRARRPHDGRYTMPHHNIQYSYERAFNVFHRLKHTLELPENKIQITSRRNSPHRVNIGQYWWENPPCNYLGQQRRSCHMSKNTSVSHLIWQTQASRTNVVELSKRQTSRGHEETKKKGFTGHNGSLRFQPWWTD